MARPKSKQTYLDGISPDQYAEQQKARYAKWEKRQGAGLNLWEELSPVDVHTLLGQVLQDGGYCGVSKTRDGGSICFTVMLGDNRYKLYVASADELEAEVEDMRGSPL